MTDDRMDLSPLDPTGDREHFEPIVASIADRAALELARRRARTSAFGQIAGWRRPMLAAAAAIVIASVAVLTQVAIPTNDVRAEGLAVAMGVPQGLAEWVTGGGTPTPADLLAGLAGEGEGEGEGEAR